LFGFDKDDEEGRDKALLDLSISSLPFVKPKYEKESSSVKGEIQQDIVSR
jgi:hypothetical protein